MERIVIMGLNWKNKEDWMPGGMAINRETEGKREAFSEVKKSGGQEGKLINKSSLSETSQVQQIDTSSFPIKY